MNMIKKSKIIIDKKYNYEKKELGTAIFSEDYKYRYLLERDWSKGSSILFILLNPSTADADKLDPTLKRAYNIAKKYGYGKLVVVNIFAVRGSDPSVIKDIVDPIGELNNYYIKKYSKKADRIIIGWGNHGIYKNRSLEILKILKIYYDKIYVLGINKSGEPKHPLYTKKNIKLKKYNYLQNI
jgi:hypothetical protein